jgi:hypothetical protein
VEYISRQFLGTRYKEGTLTGNERIPETLVVDLSGVDCFTFIDYVEALRLSDSLSTFKKNLIRVRYRSGVIAFDRRNHFFSDWCVFNTDFIEDTTALVGGSHTSSSTKNLNVRRDGTSYLHGITPVARDITYIPLSAIEESLLQKCRTGDYIGIYAEDPGLDVTHVGILVKKRGMAYLRHASSLSEYRRVIDQDFRSYMSNRPGFIVLRPRSPEAKTRRS